jgi:hypothetical protein
MDEETLPASVFEFCGQLSQSASPLESLYAADGHKAHEEPAVANEPVNPALHRHAARVADPSELNELAGQAVQS